MLVVLFAMYAMVPEDCVSPGFYHTAAKALQFGMGDLSTNAVCKYGEDENLDNNCNIACQCAPHFSHPLLALSTLVCMLSICDSDGLI